jgi:hypothetical protein
VLGEQLLQELAVLLRHRLVPGLVQLLHMPEGLVPLHKLYPRPDKYDLHK